MDIYSKLNIYKRLYFVISKQETQAFDVSADMLMECQET